MCSHNQDGVSDHSFLSEQINGVEFLGPCLECNLPAADAVRTLAFERDVAQTRLRDVLGVLGELKELSFHDEELLMELAVRIKETL